MGKISKFTIGWIIASVLLAGLQSLGPGKGHIAPAILTLLGPFSWVFFNIGFPGWYTPHNFDPLEGLRMLAIALVVAFFLVWLMSLPLRHLPQEKSLLTLRARKMLASLGFIFWLAFGTGGAFPWI